MVIIQQSLVPQFWFNVEYEGLHIFAKDVNCIVIEIIVVYTLRPKHKDW